jgi:hypothetical protein
MEDDNKMILGLSIGLAKDKTLMIGCCGHGDETSCLIIPGESSIHLNDN